MLGSRRSGTTMVHPWRRLCFRLLMAVGKKLFLSLDVCLFADLYHLPDGGSSKQMVCRVCGVLSIVYSLAEGSGN